jgi:non-ribosomal peptide synthetase component F
MTLLTAFSVLLSRFADQDDVIIGTPIANRRQSELEDLIGFFANTLTLRVRVHPALTFRELLRNVREVTLGAYANQDVPFEKLVEELQPVRDLNRNPFFQVTFGVQNIPHSELHLPGLSLGVQEFVTGATRFDLECFLREEGGELRGIFVYNTDLFAQQTIESLLHHFEHLLETVVANPTERVSDLPNPFSDLSRVHALVAPEQPNVAEEVAPIVAETPTAELLSNIWADVLGLERVGLHDNFFDLGGHSLLATRVISRVREAFKLEAPLRRLFEMPTVFELAAYIDSQLGAGSNVAPPPIRRYTQDGPRPLSFAQQRLWFWEQLEPNTPTYNLISAFRLEGELDLSVLEQSLNEIVRRHEILRTSFTAVDGEPVQVVAPRKNLRLNLVDLSWLPVTERESEARRLTGEEALRPFALHKAPLFRLTLLRLGPQEHVAVVAMHHIISDGWSMGIFIDEVTALYDSYRLQQPSSLPDLPVQYADFARWQSDLLQPGSETLDSQLSYWKEQLRNAPSLELPTDRRRPRVYNPRGAIMPVSFSAELSSELKILSRRERVTLFMTLLASFNVMLHAQSGQEDIIVGTDIANRTRVETEGLIGFFVNMLVLRTDLGGNPTFSELLQRVREVTLGAYAHQDVPFAKLVGELHVKRDLSRNPLFQVVCVLQNASTKRLKLPGLMLSPFEFDITTAPFDMVLSLNETDEGLAGSITYNIELFNEQTVRRMFSHYRQVLERVVANPNQPLSSLKAFARAVAGD